MSWKLRQSLGKCQHGRCDSPLADGADYCEAHDADKKRRNRLWKLRRKVQLRIPFVHRDQSR